jgi:hypothetical protein
MIIYSIKILIEKKKVNNLNKVNLIVSQWMFRVTDS